ncbi:MAG: glycosyl hydrolase family 18 protein [Acidimicrobiia bacterium]|nr:glycosyl hydrolase family 18 protein [Acidimicrobiia bacterium]
MRIGLLTAVVVVILASSGGAMASDAIGFVDPATGQWHLPDRPSFYYGNPGDNPLMGDWDCDGSPSPGQHRTSDGFIYLRDSISQGIADRRFFFGNPGDLPIAGDWNGDGCDTVSLWRPAESRVYIIDRLGSQDGGLGAADRFYTAGQPGQVPFVIRRGAVDVVGFHDPVTGRIVVDGQSSFFGNPGDKVVAGQWHGVAELGAFRPRDRLTFAGTDIGCVAGARSWLPVAAPLPPAPSGPIEVSIDPEERKAVGPAVSLLVEFGDDVARLDDCSPTAAIDAALGTVLTITYVSGDKTDASWTQTVSGPSVVLRQPWRDGTASTPGDIVLAWQSTGSSAGYLSQIDAAPGLTVTSPIWWRLDAAGDITGSGDAGFVQAAHARGMDVWPGIASLDADNIHAALADPEGLAARVAALAAATGADGVNIDLEGFRHPDAAAVTSFATELTRLAHEWGGLVSFDITPRTDSWDITSIDFEAGFWSLAPQRRELAAAVDYLILMAYDEHNAHRPAGPVASPHWVEDVTRYLLRYTDSHRLILGVPFYGRLWGPDLLDRPRAIGIGSLTASERRGTRSYDERFGLDRVDFADGTYLWSETPAGLAHRVALKDELGLAGLAAWRLGFDSPSIWPVIAG